MMKTQDILLAISTLTSTLDTLKHGNKTKEYDAVLNKIMELTNKL